MIEGFLTDHDGTIYQEGDVVWLAPGTKHKSYKEKGCTVAIFLELFEEQVDQTRSFPLYTDRKQVSNNTTAFKNFLFFKNHENVNL